MNKIESYEQIQGFVTIIRNSNDGYYSNFYWDSKKHPYWIASDKFSYIKASDTCFLLIMAHENMSRVFYIASSINSIRDAFNQYILSERYALDVVSREQEPEELKCFKGLGFKILKNLYRMSTTQIKMDEYIQNNNVDYADEANVNCILDMLNNNFDYRYEQIPSLQEIKDYIMRKEILVYKKNNNICGFVIYEIIGVTYYLRYWFTAPSYRNMHVGSSLLRASFAHVSNVKRYILWVISDNSNAIDMYVHYGFETERMYDIALFKN